MVMKLLFSREDYIFYTVFLRQAPTETLNYTTTLYTLVASFQRLLEYPKLWVPPPLVPGQSFVLEHL